MELPRVQSSTWASITGALGASLTTWVVTGMLPLPVLVMAGPAGNADIACLYLGLGCGWLAMDVYRRGGLPTAERAWTRKMLAIVLAVATNVAAFILFGLAADVQTSFPFALMAAFTAVPAIGMIPWLARRTPQPHVAMVCGCVLVGAAKLSACVVARVRYGPDFLAQGYISADWRSAKLMISLFWTLSILLSLTLLILERRRCGRIPASTGPEHTLHVTPPAAGSAA